MISPKEKERLRELAKQQIQLANSERNQQLIKEWWAHGDMDKESRPMILIEPNTFADELIQPRLQSESDLARELEYSLLFNTLNFKYFKDDMLVRDYLPVDIEYRLQPFGIAGERIKTEGIGYHIEPQVVDLEADFHKLSKSILVNNGEDRKVFCDFARENVGDILPIKETGSCPFIVPTYNVVHVMGMENMYMAMIDEPELFHKMMKMLTNDYIEVYQKMEEEGMLLPTNGDVRLLQGSYCFTSDLPKTGIGLKTSQVWLYMDSQEASAVSPEMYHEFFAPYYQQLSEQFGLLCYGCCESVSGIWKDSVSKYKNLRKVSIAPWCDEEYMGEQLQDYQAVYQRKPTPNLIGVDKILDEVAARDCIAKTLAATKGVKKIEFSQRDVYTVHKDLKKVERYVQIIREECEKR